METCLYNFKDLVDSLKHFRKLDTVTLDVPIDIYSQWHDNPRTPELAAYLALEQIHTLLQVICKVDFLYLSIAKAKRDSLGKLLDVRWTAAINVSQKSPPVPYPELNVKQWSKETEEGRDIFRLLSKGESKSAVADTDDDDHGMESSLEADTDEDHEMESSSEADPNDDHEIESSSEAESEYGPDEEQATESVQEVGEGLE